MRVKKIICVLLLLILALSAALAASCGPGGGAADDPNTTTQEPGGEETTAEPARVMPDLPDMDFEGRVFLALGRDDSKYQQFVNFEIEAESINGELVNDAVYNRNRRLEDRYNIKIEQDLREDPPGILQRLVKADDDVYNLAFIVQNNIGSMASSGMFYDLHSLKYLDFEKPWWSLEVNKSISVGNRLYFTTSDFNMMDKNRTYMLAFNKDLAEAYGLGNFYDLVYSSRWTVDKMAELCKAVSSDVDGDGIMTDADRWGLGMDSYNAFYTFWSACDNYMFTKDAGDYPLLSVNNEHTVSSIDRLMKLTNDESISFYCNSFQGKVSYDFWYVSSTLFYEGRLLFTATFTHGLRNYAQSDVNYGVLPFPKYDENQANYISTADNYHSALFAVPMTAQDPDFSGFMLEALSAASKYEVMPYYYEVSTKTKYTYDEESPKMLDIIFGGLRYDLGATYNWGGINDLFRVTLPQTGQNSFVSKYESMEAKILKAMEKTINTFNELP